MRTQKAPKFPFYTLTDTHTQTQKHRHVVSVSICVTHTHTQSLFVSLARSCVYLRLFVYAKHTHKRPQEPRTKGHRSGNCQPGGRAILYRDDDDDDNGDVKTDLVEHTLTRTLPHTHTRIYRTYRSTHSVGIIT